MSTGSETRKRRASVTTTPAVATPSATWLLLARMSGSASPRPSRTPTELPGPSQGLGYEPGTRYEVSRTELLLMRSVCADQLFLAQAADGCGEERCHLLLPCDQSKLRHFLARANMTAGLRKRQLHVHARQTTNPNETHRLRDREP